VLFNGSEAEKMVRYEMKKVSFAKKMGTTYLGATESTENGKTSAFLKRKVQMGE
jgi:hypothetical protein